MEKDLFDQFTDLYEKGLWVEALQLIIPSPSIQYDTLSSREESFPLLVNYADACVFHGALAFDHTQKTLDATLVQSEPNKIIYDSFVQELKQEAWLYRQLCLPVEELEKQEDLPLEAKEFFLLLKQGYLLNKERLHHCLEVFNVRQQNLLKRKFPMMQGWERVCQKRPGFAKFIEMIPSFFRMPWIPYAYPLQARALPEGNVKPSEEVIPLIFLEPLQNLDYEAYLQRFIGKEMILIVETMGIFYQMLQFPFIATLLDDPKVYFYVLEHPAAEQLLQQGFKFDGKKVTAPYLMLARPEWEASLPVFTKAFNQLLADITQFTWLNALAKKIVYEGGLVRYGKSRFIAYSIEEGMKSWFKESLSEQLPLDADLGPPSKDMMLELIEEYKVQRHARTFAPDNRIRLTHVVPQIVDGGHAPTRLLTLLCSQADKTWFDISVLCTERLIDHQMSYPTTTFSSESSFKRGDQTINIFNQLGIKTLVDDQTLSFETSIENAIKGLSLLVTDIVVFHGPDEINQLVAAACDVPIRIFFDHGTLPKYSCFDLLILSTEEAYKQNQAYFLKLGMDSCYLLYSVDVRKDWLERPFSKEQLGFPEDAFIMTTISNHLERRITPAMAHAIGAILKRCKNAYYAPMGPVTDVDKYTEIFKQYGVENRVKFLGHVSVPSQVARSMHLYLNEFPFGSGLGMLDAMAAGCPVVSMYDENGAQQARYGGNYFGMDYVIKSGKVDDYINLACQLIEDHEMYEKWSTHAVEQYEKRFDVEKYVQNFELIIEKFIAHFTRNSK